MRRPVTDSAAGLVAVAGELDLQLSQEGRLISEWYSTLAVWSALNVQLWPGLIGPESTAAPQLSKCTDCVDDESFVQVTRSPMPVTSA